MLEQLKVELGKVSRYARKAGVKKGKSKIIQITIKDERALCKNLLADLSVWHGTIDDKIGNLASSQEQILKAMESITNEAKGINTATKEIENKVTKVNVTTDQIATTTKTYKDVVTRGLRVLRGQLFLRLLLTTCRASESTLDLESRLGTLRQS
jgi:hypothetical protein